MREEIGFEHVDCGAGACPVDFNEEELVSAEPFTIFAIEDCKWCREAAQLLAGRGLDFEKVTLLTKATQKTFLDSQNLKGIAATFPQVFQGDHRIGGYTELAAELDA